jgi:CheY-like chemotaxis protein
MTKESNRMRTPATILVVDDDPDIREVLRTVLEKEGHRITAASNGKEAMALIEADAPDLMILDIMMTTDTEGFDLMFELQGDPEFKDIPIILLTSFLEKVRSAGPDGFEHIVDERWGAKWIFEKPIDIPRLIEMVEAILDER